MKNISQKIILDSFALIAWARKETAALTVRDYLTKAAQGKLQLILPLINLGEILYIVERRNGIVKAQDMQGAISEMPIEILPATRERVLAAAHIKANHPISYADSFVAAAAQEFNAPILTGDPEFKSVEAIISVEWLTEE